MCDPGTLPPPARNPHCCVSCSRPSFCRLRPVRRWDRAGCRISDFRRHRHPRPTSSARSMKTLRHGPPPRRPRHPLPVRRPRPRQRPPHRRRASRSSCRKRQPPAVLPPLPPRQLRAPPRARNRPMPVPLRREPGHRRSRRFRLKPIRALQSMPNRRRAWEMRQQRPRLCLRSGNPQLSTCRLTRIVRKAGHSGGWPSFLR